MKLHRNAALSWNGRRQLAERVVVEGWTVVAAAEAAGVSVRCARKWIGRYNAAGEAGLIDRSSAPRTVANRTPSERVRVIAKLRRLRMTAAEIAETLAMPLSTVSGILTRTGMGRLGRIGLEPAIRYERSRPGELVHVDIKKLGRIERGAGKRWRDDQKQHYTGSYTDTAGVRRGKAGWEYVHIAVDDHNGVPPLSWTPERLARLGRAGGWCSCQSGGSTPSRIRRRFGVTRSRWSVRVAVRSGRSRASSGSRMSRCGSGASRRRSTAASVTV